MFKDRDPPLNFVYRDMVCCLLPDNSDEGSQHILSFSPSSGFSPIATDSEYCDTYAILKDAVCLMFHYDEVVVLDPVSGALSPVETSIRGLVRHGAWHQPDWNDWNMSTINSLQINPTTIVLIHDGAIVVADIDLEALDELLSLAFVVT
ncbi:hypothetical protein KIPB_002713 [Kipferlia bialata]|uniref:Uncharacterized protein n=1 Tax=Kipferlia bialata TaxID=797122 RepID=A0A391NUJ8_9EUKA|nr:hypothetical protein KIPB_002713 [Kipferlia bialata]|eukprot:g2713.t1